MSETVLQFQEMNSSLSNGMDDQKRRFVDALLQIVPDSPMTDFPKICELWVRTLGGDWAWLWLFNPTNERWELAECFPAANPKILPPHLIAPGDDSVTEFSHRAQRAVAVDDLAGWQEPYEGTTYRVVSAAALRQMGCAGFQCVPLLNAHTGVSLRTLTNLHGHPDIRMSLCVHYRDWSKRVVFPESSLMLMGRLTALALVNSYEAEQRAILLQLNGLAHRYLTKVSRRPLEHRDAYLKELLNLIQHHLRVKCLSIFEHDPSSERLQCLATTGIYRKDGTRVSPDAMSDVFYVRGNSRTWQCFEKCETLVSTISNPGESGGNGSVWREMPPSVDENSVPWAIQPIPLPVDLGAPRKALGVIRCTSHDASFAPDRPRNFDPAQVQTLGFIASQIAPGLATLAVNVQRELVVGAIKHDLFAPLRMIQDAVLELQRGHAEIPYALKNLGAAALLAVNLVAQLDPDPSEVRKFNPVPTRLEGDIVARIKAMLRHYAHEERGMEI